MISPDVTPPPHVSAANRSPEDINPAYDQPRGKREAAPDGTFLVQSGHSILQ
jgi:hypothetical protein